MRCGTTKESYLNIVIEGIVTRILFAGQKSGWVINSKKYGNIKCYGTPKYIRCDDHVRMNGMYHDTNKQFYFRRFV
jgi:hypothetical protein